MSSARVFVILTCVMFFTADLVSGSCSTPPTITLTASDPDSSGDVTFYWNI
jgi:hypothetical protein